MDTKTLLIELCENLQSELNYIQETPRERSVCLYSGTKPENYWLPNIYISTTKPVPKELTMAWFVELIIDGQVIFRETHVPRDSEDLKIVEAFLLKRLLRNIFTFGVMESKKYLDNFKK